MRNTAVLVFRGILVAMTVVPVVIFIDGGLVGLGRFVTSLTGNLFILALLLAYYLASRRLDQIDQADGADGKPIAYRAETRTTPKLK